MVLVKGKYNEAKIFTDNVDSKAIEQVKTFLDTKASQNSIIRIMPDVHVGYDIPIGYTQTITDKVIPNFVGVDIGCGMLVTKFSEKDSTFIDFKKLDQIIRKFVPSGFNVFNEKQNLDLDLSNIIASFNYDRALKSVGTLGSGNHFIEVNKGESGYYLIIHSGSRHLGVEVNKYWTNKIDKNVGFLEGNLFNDYLNDMKIVQKFASINRKRMRDNIFKEMNFTIVEEFESVHNYIDLKHNILRKGATSARKGEKLLIPINMRDGSIIAIGLGNPDWNYSAPHGAGRVMSRNEAKKNISLDKFINTMEGVWTTSVNHRTLDESPFVYKDLNEILKHTKETIKVFDHVKTLYNYKA